MTIQTRDISQLYKELAPQVFRFCMFISRDKTIAEDATSEAFTKALDKYDLAMVENPKSLLFTIAKNHILGAARKTKKLQPVDDVFIEQVEEASKGTEQQAIEAELVKKLESALGKLDPETRTVIALRTYEELSFSEIAEIIQDTEGATKMRYYRGISELNEIMNKQKTTKARVFALPVLLLGVREVFALSNYHVSPAFMASLWKGLVTNFSLPISNSMNIINIIKAKLGLAAVSTKLIVLGGAVIIVPLCGGIVANVIWPTRSECAVDFTDGVNGAMVISGDRSCQFTVLRFERDMTGSSDECLTSDNPSTFRAGTGELRPNPAAGKCVQLDIPGFGGVKAGNWVEPSEAGDTPVAQNPLADWEVVPFEDCGANIYLPPRELPYYIEGTPAFHPAGYDIFDRRGQYWQVTRQREFTAWGLIEHAPFTMETEIRYLHSPEIRSQYVGTDYNPGTILVSCGPNPNGLTTQELVDQYAQVMVEESFSTSYERLDVVPEEPIAKWGHTAIRVAVAPLDYEDASFYFGYFMATDNYLYWVYPLGSRDEEVRDHMYEIVDNLSLDASTVDSIGNLSQRCTNERLGVSLSLPAGWTCETTNLPESNSNIPYGSTTEITTGSNIILYMTSIGGFDYCFGGCDDFVDTENVSFRLESDRSSIYGLVNEPAAGLSFTMVHVQNMNNIAFTTEQLALLRNVLGSTVVE